MAGSTPSAWNAFTDAQGTNFSDRNVRQYTDLDLFFNKKATSKDISKVTDIQAVKRSVRNLILTNHYEKPFHPEIGSGVRVILFEPMTPLTAHILTRKITTTSDSIEYADGFTIKGKSIELKTIHNEFVPNDDDIMFYVVYEIKDNYDPRFE